MNSEEWPQLAMFQRQEAGAQLPNCTKMVYLHAGHCEGQNLNDFMAINMITMQWTKFTDSGFTDGVCDHTITRVAEKHILLIGGNLGSTVSDRVLLFDVEDRAWTEQDSLSLRWRPQ